MEVQEDEERKEKQMSKGIQADVESSHVCNDVACLINQEETLHVVLC